MPDRRRLLALLQRLDGRPYPGWRDLEGSWCIDDLEIVVDRVQGDPFAAPSRLRLLAPTALDPELLADPDARLAAEDWLLRRFGESLPGGGRGSGKSGLLEVYRPGPEIVERSALRLHGDGIAEVRLTAGLPARGRRILGGQGRAMLLEDLPAAAARLAPGPGLMEQVRSVRAQRALRRALRARGLVAFVADEAVLPRASGVEQRPLPDAVPFRSPDSLRVTLDTPEGPVQGMGVPEGVTLVVGGGFHGKSTLLGAIQRGHLDHIPGDGRERVVADPDTVKVRAEDGRRVERVDISAFLGPLPGGRDTRPFSTDDASGSTSQAASLVEAAESGARVVLLDEDTCATNLLVRDARMRELIPDDREPITPLLARVRELHRVWGVSTIMVAGGLGDWLSVADRVVAMHRFVPEDVSARAREVAGPQPPQPAEPLGPVSPRVPLPLPTGGKIRARDADRLRFGDQEVDLQAVEQVLDSRHAATLGEALRFLFDNVVDGRRDLRQVLDELDGILDGIGIDALSPWPDPPGFLVRPRRHEVAAALSRLRTLRVR